MNTTFDFPDDWPKWPPTTEEAPVNPDDKPQPLPKYNPKRLTPLPLGYVQFTARLDLKRFVTKLGAIQNIVEPANPRDGTRLILTAGNIDVEEDVDEVLARINAAQERLQNDGRGF